MSKTDTAPVTDVVKNPMKEFVSVFLPRATGKAEDFVFVGLNGKGYTIKRGMQVRVPRPVAEILWEAERNATRQIRYEQQLKDQAGASARMVGLY